MKIEDIPNYCVHWPHRSHGLELLSSRSQGEIEEAVKRGALGFYLANDGDFFAIYIEAMPPNDIYFDYIIPKSFCDSQRILFWSDWGHPLDIIDVSYESNAEGLLFYCDWILASDDAIAV